MQHDAPPKGHYALLPYIMLCTRELGMNNLKQVIASVQIFFFFLNMQKINKQMELLALDLLASHVKQADRHKFKIKLLTLFSKIGKNKCAHFRHVCLLQALHGQREFFSKNIY